MVGTVGSRNQWRIMQMNEELEVMMVYALAKLGASEH